LLKDPKSRPTLTNVMEHDWVTDEGSDFLPRWEEIESDDYDNESTDNGLHRVHSQKISGKELRDAITAIKESKPRFEMDLGEGIQVVQQEQDDWGSDSDIEEEANDSESTGTSHSQANLFDFQRAKSGARSKPKSTNDLKFLEEMDNEDSDIEGKKKKLVACVGSKAEWIRVLYSFHLDQNTRHNMEDTVQIQPQLTSGNTNKAFFAGVYDGHGGLLVSSLLSERLHNLVKSSKHFTSNMPQALIESFLETDRKMMHDASNHILEQKRKVDAGTARQGLVRTKGDRNQTQDVTEGYQKAGSTAVVCTIVTTTEKREMTIAWVGDSRAVLSSAGKAVELSQDHKAIRADETARVRAAGGSVDRKGRIDGSLAVSRAFGDLLYKGHDIEELAKMAPVGESRKDDEMLVGGAVIALPDICTLQLMDDDEFVIMATDGLWDVVTNQEAVNFVGNELVRHQDVNLAARNLVNLAKDKESIDNISVVIVYVGEIQ